MTTRRVRVRVDGTVQGVGYRPFVYRIADELGDAGWVLNDERGVLVEAEGSADVVEAFVERLCTDAPPLADVRGVESQDIPPLGESGFQIVASERGSAARKRPPWSTSTWGEPRGRRGVDNGADHWR